MKVMIAMDSFKGNLTSLKAATVVESGLRKVYPDAEVVAIAIADGGEGTVEAIVDTLNGEYIKIEAQGPLGAPVLAQYGKVNDTAIIEMAEASGLYLIDEDKRNPFKTSTYGTGELIIDAMDKGCKKIILGIGGSATNDGGTGMAKALGAKFLDEAGNELEEGGGSLNKLSKIDLTNFDNRVSEVEFVTACDVTNPLCGETGSSRVFGPQKGADEDMVEVLDSNLMQLAEIAKKDLNTDYADADGAGAAGGLGFGLLTFCGSELAKGIDIVLDTIDFESRLDGVDVVITGEGRIDSQTAFGKVPVGIAKRAKKSNLPVYVIAGFAEKGAEEVYKHGIDAVMSSMVGPLSLDEAIKDSIPLIENASERLFRIIKSARELIRC